MRQVPLHCYAKHNKLSLESMLPFFHSIGADAYCFSFGNNKSVRCDARIVGAVDHRRPA